MDEGTGRVTFSRTEGRTVFGTVAGIYATARPEYPERVFEVLRERCGLGAATLVLEIGAGAGLATRRLLGAGASVVAVEPSEALARELEARIGDGRDRLRVIVEAFEDAQLPAASFDLVAAATAFHWVDQSVGLSKAADILRPGGWLALWWSIFGDPESPDPFRDATHALLDPLPQSPSAGDNDIPFALDAEIQRTGRFGEIDNEVVRWTLELDPPAVRRLYATFSPIARLPKEKRIDILDALERIATDDFGGRVERRMVTPIYTARREH